MFNKTIIIGNLTKDIQLNYVQNGTAIAKGTVASNYKYKSANNDQKEEVCYLDFNLFGRSAEVANQYLKKGSKVLLEGRLVLENWTAQDGTNRSKHSLRVENMKMLGGQNETYQPSSDIETNDTKNKNIEDMPDVIPF